MPRTMCRSTMPPQKRKKKNTVVEKKISFEECPWRKVFNTNHTAIASDKNNNRILNVFGRTSKPQVLLVQTKHTRHKSNDSGKC